MDCICRHMSDNGLDMSIMSHKSVEYKQFSLHETYGTWHLEFQDKEKGVSGSIEIFHCPLCGRELNNWSWAKDRAKENLKGYL